MIICVLAEIKTYAVTKLSIVRHAYGNGVKCLGFN